MENVLIIGASGLIGQALSKGLKGYNISSFRGRDIQNTPVDELSKIINGYDIIINLAGRTLFTLWTKKTKKSIYNSRIDTTRKISEAINICEKPPEHIINASAIGIYKTDVLVDESENTYADNFLSKVVMDWEKQLNQIKNNNIKRTFLRIGIVMSNKGGAYKTLKIITKLNLGAYFDGGKQGFSFILIDDVVKAVDFIIKKKITGAVNLVSPDITNYRELMRAMKKQHKAFVIWPLPGVILKVLFGEASLLLLKGHKVKPSILKDHGFQYLAPDLNACIKKLNED